MKEEFLNFVKNLMEHDKNYSDSILTENIKTYMSALESGGAQTKIILTDNGKLILKYMQTLTLPMKSADIAVGMGMAPKSVSGSLRKLVSDHFVEKIGDKASSVYIITEKGKNFNID